MYWFRSDASLSPFTLIALPLLWTLGGYLVLAAGFRLQRRERLICGLALGVAISVWLANLLGRWLSPTLAFWLACLAVPAIGLIAAGRHGFGSLPRVDRKGWGLLAAVLAVAALVLLIGRGVGILDDRKNLSFISIIAAGNIPPHFYMNAEILPAYHYGFQLLAAIPMRLAGMFPWSAFDLAKGLIAGLAITLSALVGWRLTHRPAGSAVMAVVVGLASGGRWLLLLLPQGLLRTISAQVTLWGSAATTAPNLYDGLASSWVVEGGPPVPIPFAFVNGILQPFVLGSQAGPGAFSVAILMLTLLLVGRARGWFAYSVLAVVFATWALVFEADFVLFGLGLALAAAYVAVRSREGAAMARNLPRLLAAFVLAGVVSLLQGGTLTDMAAGLLQRAGSSASELAAPLGFSLRWPPAIVSSHLGELGISHPLLLLAGLLELGPLLLAAPIGLWVAARFARRGRAELCAWGLAGAVGLLLPLIVRYQSERDITRLSAFGLLALALLALPAIGLLLQARPTGWLRWAGAGWMGACCLGGLVVAGSLLTAIPRATLSPDIAPIDARMADRFWGRLEPGALVLDSSAWRAVALTGLLTKSAPDSLSTYPEWEAMVAAPRLGSALEMGFRYVYVDEYWWQQMGAESGPFGDNPCVSLLGMERDNQANGSRRLFDIGACQDR